MVLLTVNLLWFKQFISKIFTLCFESTDVVFLQLKTSYAESKPQELSQDCYS